MNSKVIFRYSLLVVATTGILFAQQPTFAPPVNYPVGNGPQSVVISDFNSDGIPDIAVTNPGPNNISIFLGRGDGTFAAAAPAVVDSPIFLAVADLNGDGKVDMVVSSGRPYISVLFGNGDGTFGAPVLISAGRNATGIAIGDLNGDGKPDIAIANYFRSGGYVTLLFNKGDGTFNPPVHLGAGHVPYQLKIADVNDDGKADLIVIDQGTDLPHQPGSVAVLLGHGDGTFDAAQFYAAGKYLQGFVVGDFNRDGKLDLAVANFPLSGGAGSIAVLLGNGDGSFQSPSFYAAGTLPVEVALADFNGDGKQDLAVADAGGGSYAVLTGNSDGTFQPPLFVLSGAHATYVAAADLNADGKPDIVGLDFVTYNMTVFLNTTP